MAEITRIAPCTVPCQGHSCCNCCGDAPNMHREGFKYFPCSLYDPKCCSNTRLCKPEECMHLCGKTREEWMKEDPT